MTAGTYDVSVGAGRSTANQPERCRQASCSRGSTADCRQFDWWHKTWSQHWWHKTVEPALVAHQDVGASTGGTTRRWSQHWWHNKTVEPALVAHQDVGASTGGTRRWSQHNATLVDQVDQRRGRVDRGKMERLHVGPCRLVRQNSELVLYALWVPQPAKADECTSDVVTGHQTVDKRSRPTKSRPVGAVRGLQNSS